MDGRVRVEECWLPYRWSCKGGEVLASSWMDRVRVEECWFPRGWSCKGGGVLAFSWMVV